jgi:large subunit ribosomal protein L24
MPRIRLNLGDRVRVTAGRSKGAEGRILAINYGKNRVVIEGVNVVRKTLKPTQENPRGGFTDQEAAINSTNVQIIDPQTGEISRIGFTILESGEKVRVSRKSGAQLND